MTRPPVSAMLCAAVFWFGAALAGHAGAFLPAMLFAVDGILVAAAVARLDAVRNSRRSPAVDGSRR